MIANLFTTLPLQIELRHITNQPKPRKKLNALEEFTHAYLKHDDSTKVIIAFWYDSEKHIKRITKALSGRRSNYKLSDVLNLGGSE